MSNPVATPPDQKRWKYGWNPAGHVLAFSFRPADFVSLPDIDPTVPGLKRTENGFYVFIGPTYYELTPPHNLFRWNALDPSSPQFQTLGSFLWVRRPNGVSHYLPVTNEQDPAKSSAFAYVGSQDYKLSLEAGAPIYRKLFLNLATLSSGTSQIPPVPLTSEFILQVTVVGDYVDPRDFNQNLNQAASPTHRGLTITGEANLRQIVTFRHRGNRLQLTNKDDPEAPNGQFWPAELDVDLEASEGVAVEKALRVHRGVTRIREARVKKMLAETNKLPLGLKYRDTSNLDSEEERARDLSNYDVLPIAPPVDNVVISSGIPEALEDNPPARPVLQYNAAEGSWQVGLAGENTLAPLAPQGPYATKLFTNLFNIARLTQGQGELSQPAFSNALALKDPERPTNLRYDDTIRIAYEVLSSQVLEKVLLGISQIVVGDRGTFLPQGSGPSRSAFLGPRQVALGSPRTSAPPLTAPANPGDVSERLQMGEPALGVHALKVERLLSGEVRFAHESSTGESRWLVVSPDGKEVTLTLGDQSHKFTIGQGVIQYTVGSLINLADSYLSAVSPTEVKLDDLSGWSLQSGRLDFLHLVAAKIIKGSARPPEVSSQEGGESSLSAVERPSPPLISLTGCPSSSARVSLKTLVEYLFARGDHPPSDPISGSTPYEYSLMGRHNPYSPYSPDRHVATLGELMALYTGSWDSGVDALGGLLYHIQTGVVDVHRRVDEVDERKADKGGFALGQLQVNRKPAFGAGGQFSTPAEVEAESPSPNFTAATTYLGADGLWHYLFRTVVLPVED